MIRARLFRPGPARAPEREAPRARANPYGFRFRYEHRRMTRRSRIHWSS